MQVGIIYPVSETCSSDAWSKYLPNSTNVRNLIIFSKYSFFIRHFRSQFYQFLNQILDALSVESKRLQLLHTTWLQDLASAKNQFTVRAQPRRRLHWTWRSIDLSSSILFVRNDWHLCGLTIQYTSAILNGSGPQIREHISLQSKIYVFHSKPFCTYYTDFVRSHSGVKVTVT